MNPTKVVKRKAVFLDIDPDLWAKVKSVAAIRKQTTRAFVTELLVKATKST